MTADTAKMGLGRRVYGLGVMALGAVCLVRGDFDPGQAVPASVPARTALAYAAAAFMLVAGAAVEWRRTARWGAAALTAYYALVVVILMDGRLVLAHYTQFGIYSSVAEQVAIAAGGLIVYAAHAELDGCATGVGFIAAGVAIATGVLARLAAILLTAMLASLRRGSRVAVLVHGPMVLADPSSHLKWAEAALHVAVNGAAWVVADSLAGTRR